MGRLVVPRSLRDAMVAHARAGAPEEVCGVLAGTRDSDGHRVEARHPAENVADRPRSRYEIDPREQLERMEAVEDAGREVVGFYHSHPRGPDEPSATDAARATWPHRSYVVVSLGGEDENALGGEDENALGGDEGSALDSAADEGASVTAWRWTGEAFAREDVRVVESA